MRYMLDKEIAKPMTATQLAAASVAFAGAALTVLLLASLHVLQPEQQEEQGMEPRSRQYPFSLLNKLAGLLQQR